MKELKITNGIVFLDDIDYDWASKLSWHVSKKGYAVRGERSCGKVVTTKMHREILGLRDPKIQVDHVNRIKLDNQRKNLRVADCSQSMANRVGWSKSGFKGVYQRPTGYVAGIRVNKEFIYLGFFCTPEDAAKAYNEAAKKHFGEFAACNFK